MTVDTLPKQAFAVNDNLFDKGIWLLLVLLLWWTFFWDHCLSRTTGALLNSLFGFVFLVFISPPALHTSAVLQLFPLSLPKSTLPFCIRVWSTRCASEWAFCLAFHLIWDSLILFDLDVLTPVLPYIFKPDLNLLTAVSNSPCVHATKHLYVLCARMFSISAWLPVTLFFSL